MKIALASDHAGFEQLKELMDIIEDLGHEYVDFGPKLLNNDDDYPDFIIPAAKAVAASECDAGVILGRSGQGEAMAANRIKGVRCAVFYGPAVARRSVDASGQLSHNPYEILRKTREHNHSNMLSLATSYLTMHDMQNAIRAWLDTPYSEEPRHERRVDKIDEMS